MSHKLTEKVLKVMGVFSGAEALGIVCSIVKMKLVALWLGATGVGLFGIYNTTVDTASIITGLGLRQSGVRDIAQSRNHKERFLRSVALLRSWSLASGLAGCMVISFFAPFLSLWFFGDSSRWWDFMILGGALLLNSLISGEQAILQGSDLLKRLAKSSASGALTGLALSIPMFRYLGDKSVPLSILAYGISMLVFLVINRNRSVPYRLAPIREMGAGMGVVKLGGFIAAATFATNLAQMIFLSWLNRETSTVEVGYFQAGNTLVFRYTSLIFGAVGLEFYPRMAANSYSPGRMMLFVSHEITLLLRIFTPMLVVFLLLRGVVVDLLYTADFEVIVPFITIAIFTVILRSVSTCMAFTIIAKGDGKTYLVTESVDAAIGLTLNIILYSHLGLLGIGIAQVLWYAIYSGMISVIYFHSYRMRIKRATLLNILLSILISGIGIVLAFLLK